MATYILTSKNLRPQWVPVFAPVRLTLTGAAATNKYVLQIFEYDEATSTYGDKIADIRQSPNADGNAIMDIQNILQSFIGVDPDVESTNKFATSTGSTYTIGIKTGEEDPNGVVTLGSTYEPYELVPTRLEYYETIDNTAINASPSVSGDDSINNCTIVNAVGELLTDMPTYTAGQFSGGRPAQIGSTDAIHRVKLTRDDYMTATFLNEVIPAAPLPEAEVKGCEGWWVFQYNGNSFLTSAFIANDTTNGGGPNAAIGDGDTIIYPYTFESFQVSGNNTGFTLNANATHYYVYGAVYSPSGCGPGLYTLDPAYTPIRVDLVQQTCLDYEHIQVSWMNSYGFRDYYTFTKRNEKRVNVKRNTYYKEMLDYNGTDLTTNTYDRGETVFSQQIEESFIANTDFMDDATAQYLQNLFMSPDVRVRFGANANWFPAILTSNAYVERNFKKDKLFQYEISFKLAHPLKSQRG